MCYLVREKQAEASERGGAPLPPGFGRLRPRWIGAVAAALIGGLAVAALIAAPGETAQLTAKDSGAPAPIASSAAQVPAAAVVEQFSVTLDEGAPSTSEVASTGMGRCDH